MRRDSTRRALNLLGPLEARIMERIWAGAVKSPFVVWDVQRQMPELAYTTVMTTVARLADKGLLRPEKLQGQRTIAYHLVRTPEDFLVQASQDRVDDLIDAFGEVALAAFAARLDRLSPEQKQRLQKLGGRP